MGTTMSSMHLLCWELDGTVDVGRHEEYGEQEEECQEDLVTSCMLDLMNASH